jgi:hypothetical protein
LAFLHSGLFGHLRVDARNETLMTANPAKRLPLTAKAFLPMGHRCQQPFWRASNAAQLQRRMVTDRTQTIKQSAQNAS